MLICCSSAWREEEGASGDVEDPLCGEMCLQRSSCSEVIFASRVLCQARAALGLPLLPLCCWMLNQLFVLPSTVPGTNSLAEGWENGME